MHARFTVHPLSDAAILLRFAGGAADYPHAHALADSITRDAPAGVHDAVAAYGCVALYFDPATATADSIARMAAERIDQLPRTRATARDTVTVPVRYGGGDFSDVCARLQLSGEELIDLHTGREYTARAVGFVPGFAYLGELDERLRLPRRESPRVRVPAGSVAIAGDSTAIYPFATPGGWHLIGTTELVMFDARQAEPSLITAGTRVRFVVA